MKVNYSYQAFIQAKLIANHIYSFVIIKFSSFILCSSDYHKERNIEHVVPPLLEIE